jgi:hypothetical protein
MAIMASCYFFIHMNVKNSNQKFVEEILSLNFDVGPLKLNTYGIE